MYAYMYNYVCLLKQFSPNKFYIRKLKVIIVNLVEAGFPDVTCPESPARQVLDVGIIKSV